jgi:hypothetical protein
LQNDRPLAACSPPRLCASSKYDINMATGTANEDFEIHVIARR